MANKWSHNLDWSKKTSLFYFMVWYGPDVLLSAIWYLLSVLLWRCHGWPFLLSWKCQTWAVVFYSYTCVTAIKTDVQSRTGSRQQVELFCWAILLCPGWSYRNILRNSSTVENLENLWECVKFALPTWVETCMWSLYEKNKLPQLSSLCSKSNNILKGVLSQWSLITLISFEESKCCNYEENACKCRR